VGREPRVNDATAAQLAARRHLEAHNPGRILDVKISKVWFSAGRTRDIWEVEGIVVLKAGLFKKEQRPFRFQIDPMSGDVIGFEKV